MLSKDKADRISALLSIVKEIAGVAPQMMSISGEAMRELKDINDEIRDAAPPPDPSVPPGQPMDSAPDPSPKPGPKIVPAQDFQSFNKTPLPNKIPSGADDV